MGAYKARKEERHNGHRRCGGVGVKCRACDCEVIHNENENTLPDVYRQRRHLEGEPTYIISEENRATLVAPKKNLWSGRLMPLRSMIKR